MGSMVALGVAANRPDLVVATFLEDPPLIQGLPDGTATPSRHARRAPRTGRRQRVRRLVRRPAVDPAGRGRGRSPASEHPTWDDDEYELVGTRQAVGGPRGVHRSPWCGCTPTPSGCCATPPPRSSSPCGQPELGGLVAPEAEASLESLPGWSIHRLPAGHDVRRDAPDATVDLLADLILSVAT